MNSKIIIALLLALPVASQAENPWYLTLGAELVGRGFSGTNGAGTDDFASTGSTLALNVGIQRGKWLMRLHSQNTQFAFDGAAPDRDVTDSANEPNEIDVKVAQGDLVFGYRAGQRWYPFFGIKNYELTWQDTTPYVIGYSGLALGVAGYIPFNEKWLGYGSLAVESLTAKADANELGKASGTAVELGLFYNLSERSLLTISLESRELRNQYTDDVGQTFSFGGWSLGYSRRFQF